MKSNQKSNSLLDVRMTDYAKAFGTDGLFRTVYSAVESLTLARRRARSVKTSRIARIVNTEGKAVAYQVFQERTA